VQTYNLVLKSDVSSSFRCQKAANSLDIDTNKKSVHEINITADLNSPFNIGLVVGSSGSGKTTLMKSIYGDDCFDQILDNSKPIIDQFDESMSYEDCVHALMGVGLTSVPCWIRPVYTLSNGQRARAECALQMTSKKEFVLIDEWTSVVDRNSAKVMSHCIQKYARKSGKRIILCSCHYDIIDWINPDFVIDCNTQTYTNYRSMVDTQKRVDRLRLDIKQCDRRTWKNFSKYHYLSDKLPGGKLFTFGLYDGSNQIGFQCFCIYNPSMQNVMFSNRTVIHPDYAGLGLGIRLINETSKLVKSYGYKVRAKFSSEPVYRSMIKDTNWKFDGCEFKKKEGKSNLEGAASQRSKVITYKFKYIGE
jgi:ABC-type Mn2+/Zn2+ transport system ATPase subunit/GNAT superfamily N-acetyltransferase